MQLKEFSFISPVIEAALVFKAIETVISPDVIAQTLGDTNSVEERKRKLPSSLVVCLGKRYESVVIRFNGHCPQESGQRVE